MAMLSVCAPESFAADWKIECRDATHSRVLRVAPGSAGAHTFRMHSGLSHAFAPHLSRGIGRGLGGLFRLGTSAGDGANAWSRLKRKLAAGESATLLIISDSTGYRDISGTRRFIRWLAAQYPTHRITELYWAEWVTNAPTGPRNYGEPIVLAEGTSKAALTVLNAVLPGAVRRR